MQRGGFMRTTLLIGSLAVCAMASATEVAPIAIHSRHVLDVKNGTTSDATIIVSGNRIASIAKSAPAGVRVIELGDATVLPGLIDCHVHIEADWSDFSATGTLRHSSPDKT